MVAVGGMTALAATLLAVPGLVGGVGSSTAATQDKLIEPSSIALAHNPLEPDLS